MPRDRYPVAAIEDQLRAVAPELAERRIREIAIELYTRKGSSEARHGVACVNTEANMKVTEVRWRIARALHLTGARAQQLTKLGMPLDSIEAAVAWRKQHVPRGRKLPRFVAEDPISASDA